MSRSEFSRRAVLQNWATVAGTITVLGASAHYAEAQAKPAKEDVGYQSDPREIKAAKPV
jgi:hypothetical protein